MLGGGSEGAAVAETKGERVFTSKTFTVKNSGSYGCQLGSVQFKNDVRGQYLSRMKDRLFCYTKKYFEL